MKLLLYDNIEHRNELSYLLYKYMMEMHDECMGSASDAIDIMLKYNKHIYVLFRDNEMIGFLIMYINDQYGLSKPTAVNEYMYVLPSYRNGIATGYMMKQLAYYCNETSTDLIGYTYATSSNIYNAKKIGAEELGTIFKVSLEILKNKLRKYK